MPRRSPCASDPHTGHVPIRTHGPPHTATKLQKSRHWFRQDQRSSLHRSPTNQSANSPTLGYICTTMAASHASQPAETSGRSPQIPNQPCSANILNLRHISANQSPTSLRKSHALPVQQIKHQPVPANHTDLRLGGRHHWRAYSRGMRTPSWVCARHHANGHVFTGYAHTFTGHAHHHVMRKPTRRDQRPAQQIPNQSCPANILNLRYSPADQAPIQLTQILQTCDLGATTGAHIHRARSPPWVCASHHANGHVFTGYAHGHGHIPSCRSSRPRARLRRDQRPVSADPQPTLSGRSSANRLTQTLQACVTCPADQTPAGLLKTPGGHGRRRRRVAATPRRQGGAAACLCYGPV